MNTGEKTRYVKTTDDQLFFKVYAFQIAVVHHKGRNKITEGILPVPDTVVPLATEGCCSVACQLGNLDQSPKKRHNKIE